MPATRTDALPLTLLWLRTHREAYYRMLSWAVDDFQQGRHGSVRYYAERLRRTRDMNGSDTYPYKVDNRMLPVIARLMIQDRPQLASIIRLRYAPDLDEPGAPNASPRPRWIEVVG